MLFSYVPFGVTVMVLGCPDYLQQCLLTKHCLLPPVTAPTNPAHDGIPNSGLLVNNNCSLHLIFLQLIVTHITNFNLRICQNAILYVSVSPHL